MKRLFWVLMLTGVGLTAVAGSSWGDDFYGPGVTTEVNAPAGGVYVSGPVVYTSYYQDGYYDNGYWYSTGYRGGYWYGGAWYGPDGGYVGFDDDCDD
jgi:hypothetical protein